MTVDELLAKTDSYELSEWRAYEIVFGPLDGMWKDEVLASIHEQIQVLNRLFGAVNFEDNPVPEPTRWPRPSDMDKLIKDGD